MRGWIQTLGNSGFLVVCESSTLFPDTVKTLLSGMQQSGECCFFNNEYQGSLACVQSGCFALYDTHSHLCPFVGEWEINAFDSSLKNRGMSIRYTVRPCGNGDLVDHDRDDDLSDYIDKIDFLPRGFRPENHTVLVRVCKKARAQNNTQSLNTTAQTVGTGPRCRLRKVNIASLKGGKAPSESEIPLDVLKELDRDGERAASENQTEHGERQRQRRQANRNETDEDISSEDLMDEEITMEIVREVVENMTDVDAEAKAEESSEMQSKKNGTLVELEESNEIILDREPLLSTKAAELQNSEDMDKNLVPQNHIRIKPERLIHDLPDVEVNYTAANTTIDLSFEYDDYSYEVPWCMSCAHL